jgi:3-phenylpropionate/trans-cinnamate dioxygenase ferredoxin subunit
MAIEEPIKICPESEIGDGEIKAFVIKGKSILFARRNGKIYALDDVCSHDGALLRDGDLVDDQIQCARHGGRFDLETGRATQMPAIMAIGSYRTEINNGDIYVFLKSEGTV